jgi:hypothetical protein
MAVPMPVGVLRSRLSEACARNPAIPEAEKSPLIECPDRSARTGLGKAAALGMPGSVRAKLTAAIAATASQIHVLLCRFAVMPETVVSSPHLTLCHKRVFRLVLPPKCKQWSLVAVFVPGPAGCLALRAGQDDPLGDSLDNLLVDFIDS